jgi:hypothetical protein
VAWAAELVGCSEPRKESSAACCEVPSSSSLQPKKDPWSPLAAPSGEGWAGEDECAEAVRQRRLEDLQQWSPCPNLTWTHREEEVGRPWEMTGPS